MQKKKALKGLLAVSAVAAMFSSFGVQAQTTGSGSQSASDLSQQSASGRPNLTGKTARDGTVGNTNSQGQDNRTGTATHGASGTHGNMSNMSAQSSSTGMTGQTGQTTSQGTAGNTNSQGMDNRGGSSGAGMDQSSGSSSSSQGASGTGAATSAASSAAGGSMSKADQKALVDMAQANMAEIEGGKLAQSKGQNDQVKTFAQQMIDDHTKALKDVQQVAQQKGVTLPSEPNSEQKAMIAKLEKMTGNAFDKTYMEVAGVSAHKKVHSTLTKDEKHVKDPDVKKVADSMMPVVEQHLKAAQQLLASGTASSGK
jgi:predicted outer membrane protein